MARLSWNQLWFLCWSNRIFCHEISWLIDINDKQMRHCKKVRQRIHFMFWHKKKRVVDNIAKFGLAISLECRDLAPFLRKEFFRLPTCEAPNSWLYQGWPNWLAHNAWIPNFCTCNGSAPQREVPRFKTVHIYYAYDNDRNGKDSAFGLNILIWHISYEVVWISWSIPIFGSISRFSFVCWERTEP